MDNTDRMIAQMIADQKRKKKRIKIGLFIGLGLIIALWIAGTISNGGFKDFSEKAKYEVPDMSSYATAMAQHIATKHATNPDEVEFADNKVAKQGQVYSCIGVIISKNDFGVKKRANYDVVLRYRGDCEEDESNATNGSMWEVKSEKVTQ